MSLNKQAQKNATCYKLCIPTYVEAGQAEIPVHVIASELKERRNYVHIAEEGMYR